MTSSLNFHHLHYFWAVAHDGNLTRTAKRLRVSQSALSAQIRQLEEALGTPLFHRIGRGLTLSEAGCVALAQADEIFTAGDQLVATLKEGRSRGQLVRIGAVATLSRNFQTSFLTPLLNAPTGKLRLECGRLDDLLVSLSSHALDLVLSNRPVKATVGSPWRSRRIARQQVSIVGRPRCGRFRFEVDVPKAPMILPGHESEIRTEFDALCEQRGIEVTVLAEVDDMATMRLLARDTDAIALLPSVVVRDEIKSGALAELCVVPGLFETFYAITVKRHFQHPLVSALIERDETEILAMPQATNAKRRPTNLT